MARDPVHGPDDRLRLSSGFEQAFVDAFGDLSIAEVRRLVDEYREDLEDTSRRLIAAEAEIAERIMENAENGYLDFEARETAVRNYRTAMRQAEMELGVNPGELEGTF